MSGRLPDAPVRTPVNLQVWEDLTFLHWAYEVDAVQRLLPENLRVQQWGGVTWVGVIPFRMARVRPPRLPSPPGWGAFAELNVRAYVTGPDGGDGIWFLGMVVHRLSFALALRSFGLPYQRSDSSVTRSGRLVTCRFGTPGLVRSRADAWFTASTDAGAPLGDAERTPLIDSLTGRWTAYHRRARILWRTPVEHEPWRLSHATVTGTLTSPLRWVGLSEPAGQPLVHAARTVHARLGSLRPA